MDESPRMLSEGRTKIVERYLKAKEAVLKGGFAAEIDWQDKIRFPDITEADFLREAAWVVLSSGMREAVIRQKFPAISAAFYYWRSANQIVRNSEKCRGRALTIFGHRQKIDAINKIAEQISVQGFEIFKNRIQNKGIEFIQTLPFMGPATSYHLAKNIGLDVVKPDRHLVRVAAAAGYDNPRLLCEEISKLVGDRLSVIDLVIWRFATLNSNYLEYFS
jgi:hypothetical protein